MKSPISNRIGQVFVPVSDISRSTDWYNRILGTEGGQFGHEDRLYDVPMQGEVKLTLDAHKPVTSNSVQPICFFWTTDIAATRAFLTENGVKLVGDVQDGGSLEFLTFKDPDGNLLMVCEPKSEETRRRAGLSGN